MTALKSGVTAAHSALPARVGPVPGYNAVRAVRILKSLPQPPEGALGCLRFATTRLTDFSLRVPDGATPVRDYRRFLERPAIEAGALSGCIATLGAWDGDDSL